MILISKYIFKEMLVFVVIVGIFSMKRWLCVSFTLLKMNMKIWFILVLYTIVVIKMIRINFNLDWDYSGKWADDDDNIIGWRKSKMCCDVSISLKTIPPGNLLLISVYKGQVTNLVGDNKRLFSWQFYKERSKNL